MVTETNLSADIDTKVAKRRIKELHDKYHPEAIFMTQTGSTLYGWAIKEIYKEAWPEEKIPKILTIDIHPLKLRPRGSHKDKPTELSVNLESNEFLSVEKEVGKKLKRHNIKGDIAVIDEGRGFYVDSIKGKPHKSVTHRFKTLPVYEPDPNAKDINSKGYYLDSGGTLGYSTVVLREAVKNLRINSKVVCLGLAREQREEGGPWRRGMFSYEYKKKRGRFYHKVKSKRDREYAKKRIEHLRKWGREIGKEIREEQKKRKS